MNVPNSVRADQNNFRGGRPSMGGSVAIDPSQSFASDEAEDQESIETWQRDLQRDSCRNGERPCPFVSCRYNNYLNVDHHGLIKLSHGNRAPEDVPPAESCSLDVADLGPHTLEEVANILGLTRERIRQIELQILTKIRRSVNRLASLK